MWVPSASVTVQLHVNTTSVTVNWRLFIQSSLQCKHWKPDISSIHKVIVKSMTLRKKPSRYIKITILSHGIVKITAISPWTSVSSLYVDAAFLKHLRTEQPVWRLNRCPLFLWGSWAGSEPGWILPNNAKSNSPPGDTHTDVPMCPRAHLNAKTVSHTHIWKWANKYAHVYRDATNTRAEAPPHTPTHTHTSLLSRKWF